MPVSMHVCVSLCSQGMPCQPCQPCQPCSHAMQPCHAARANDTGVRMQASWPCVAWQGIANVHGARFHAWGTMQAMHGCACMALRGMQASWSCVAGMAGHLQAADGRMRMVRFSSTSHRLARLCTQLQTNAPRALTLPSCIVEILGRKYNLFCAPQRVCMQRHRRLKENPRITMR
jgi:hypothetical protein